MHFEERNVQHLQSNKKKKIHIKKKKKKMRHANKITEMICCS